MKANAERKGKQSLDPLAFRCAIFPLEDRIILAIVSLRCLCLGTILPLLPLFLLFAIPEGRAAETDLLEFKGRIEYSVALPDHGLTKLPDMAREFTIVSSNASWHFTSLIPARTSRIHGDEVASNGTEFFSVTRLTGVRPGANDAAAIIEFHNVPEFGLDFAGAAWWPYCSFHEFASEPKGHLPPFMRWNAVHYRIRQARTPAQWELYTEPPHAPEWIQWFSAGTLPVEGEAGGLHMHTYPPPYFHKHRSRRRQALWPGISGRKAARLFQHSPELDGHDGSKVANHLRETRSRSRHGTRISRHISFRSYLSAVHSMGVEVVH